MDCSMLGSSVLHYLPELSQCHVHGVGDASPQQGYGPWRRHTIDTLYETDNYWEPTVQHRELWWFKWEGNPKKEIYVYVWLIHFAELQKIML